MSERITLTLRAPLARPLSASAIAPDRFAGLSAKEIAELQLWDGRTPVALGDVFTVSGDRSATVVLEGDLARREPREAIRGDRTGRDRMRERRAQRERDAVAHLGASGFGASSTSPLMILRR